MTSARSIRFPADVAHLASVRDFARDAAADLGAAVDANDLAVVVGELAANAAVHQTGEAQLRVSLVDGGLQVEVRDTDPSMPGVVHGDAWDTEGHRGLLLVDALSRAWGVEPLDRGKRVWAVLALASSTDRDDHHDDDQLAGRR
ncbi:MAG: ATP-binding protein [Acidimicrobiales bacterium]|nr:ATP-binding protein [Acidimicrobiales bacterium]HRW37867.1 ATP-binding protein [Aquihabitans sp.]